MATKNKVMFVWVLGYKRICNNKEEKQEHFIEIEPKRLLQNKKNTENRKNNSLCQEILAFKILFGVLIEHS